jgi:hypothetical protein
VWSVHLPQPLATLTELVMCTFHASPQTRLNLATSESVWCRVQDKVGARHGSAHSTKRPLLNTEQSNHFTRSPWLVQCHWLGDSAQKSALLGCACDHTAAHAASLALLQAHACCATGLAVTNTHLCVCVFVCGWVGVQWW